MILFVYVSATAETEAAFPKKNKKYFVVQPFQSPDVNKYARYQKLHFYQPQIAQVLGYCMVCQTLSFVTYSFYKPGLSLKIL